jgi:type I restriction enzyme S subunit
MISWATRYLPLKKLGEIVSGSTPSTQKKEFWNGDIPWITPADLTGHSGIYFRANLKKITRAGYESCSTKLLPAGSILFSSRAPIGHCAVTVYPLCTNQGFKSIIPNEKLYSEYGFFALKYFTPQIISRGRGATFAEINKEIFEQFEIPVPPLFEQQRIAAILEKADRLHRLRRYSLELSDSYLQSVFLEMFGDPANNPMKWERANLGDVIVSAKDGPHVSPNYSDSGIPFLSTRNIRRGEIVWDDLKYITFEEAHKHWKRSGCKPERGDILYTKGGTTGLAKVVDFDQQVAVWVHVAVLKPRHDTVTSTWLENMLNTDYCYHQSQELTFGIVNRDLGLRRMPRIKIYVPPRNLQDKFSSAVQCYKRIQSQQHEALRQAEHLFRSLLHRSFEGNQ